MMRTLLLYDGKMGSSERIASGLSCLIGNAKVAELMDAPEDLSLYDGLCIVFTFYGGVTAARARAFLYSHRSELKEKRIALVGIGYSDLGYMKFTSDLEMDTGLENISAVFISSETETNRVGYELGRMMRAAKKPMDSAELHEAVEAFITAHNTMALATGCEGFVRCTPIEYIYLEGSFYLITEGGNKFRGILDNGEVSGAVFDPFVSMDTVKGLQFAGKASVIAVGSDEYQMVMDAKGVTAEALNKLPVTLFVVRIDPLRFEYLNPEFAADGFDTNQVLETEYHRMTRQAGEKYANRVKRSEISNEQYAKELQARADQEAGRSDQKSQETDASDETGSEELTDSEAAAVEMTAADSTVGGRGDESEQIGSDGIADEAGDELLEEIEVQTEAGEESLTEADDEQFTESESEGSEAYRDEESEELLKEASEIIRQGLTELTWTEDSDEVTKTDAETIAEEAESEVSDESVSEPNAAESDEDEASEELPKLAEPFNFEEHRTEPKATERLLGTEFKNFKMPELRQAFNADGESAGSPYTNRKSTLPRVDVSTFEGTGRHRFEFESVDPVYTAKKKTARSKVIERAEFDEDYESELEDEDGTIDRDADLNRDELEADEPIRTKREKKPKTQKGENIFKKIGRALGKMLLIDDVEESDDDDDEFDEKIERRIEKSPEKEKRKPVKEKKPVRKASKTSNKKKTQKKKSRYEKRLDDFDEDLPYDEMDDLDEFEDAFDEQSMSSRYEADDAYDDDEDKDY